jgi:hypothetical protein
MVVDWYAALFGLTGTILGAYISGWATRAAQERALADAKAARVETKEDSAAAVLAEEFLRLRRHLRTLPREIITAVEGEDADTRWRRSLHAMGSDWNHTLPEFLDPAEVAARSIRNEALRKRVLGVLRIVDRWWALLADPQIGHAAPLYVSNLIDHGLECLGAWQRGEEIPQAVADYDIARDSQQRTREWARDQSGLRERS